MWPNTRSSRRFDRADAAALHRQPAIIGVGMTDDRRPSDEQLLEMLKDSLDNSVEVSDDAIDMLMTGYDIVNMDVLEAELTFDSLAATGVRRRRARPAAALRADDSRRIDVELDDVSLRCSGQVAPAGAAPLEQMSGTRQLGLSESGSFDAVVEGTGPFRLRYEIGDVAVTTSWLQFGAVD